MPKINPTTKKTRPDTQGAMKDILGTEIYEEMMQPTLIEDSEEEEQQNSSFSFKESQEMELEYQSHEEEEEEEEEQEEASPVILPRRSPRKKKPLLFHGTQPATQASREVHDVSLPIITHKPTKRNRMGMSEYVEDELIDWLEATPCLYDKSLKEYKLTEKKRQIWADKAESLEQVGITMTAKDLTKWFDKMCGIARKKRDQLPSGSGRVTSAPRRRQLELKKKLDWLTPFVERKAGQTPGTPGKTKRALASRPPNAAPISFEESPLLLDDEEGPAMTSTPRTSQQLTSQQTSSSGSGSSRPTPSTSASRAPTAATSTARPPSKESKKRRASDSRTSSLIKDMEHYEEICDVVIRNLDQTVMPTEIRARKMFMDSFFMQVIQKIPNNKWAEFQNDYMKLLTDYRKKYLETPKVTSKPPPPPPSSRPGTSTSQ